MLLLTPTHKEVDSKEYIRKPASEDDFSKLIDSDTILLDENGKAILLYFKIQDDTEELRRACKDIPYLTSTRTGGLTTTSRIFGFDPATGVRKQWTSATSLSWESPRQHQVITGFGKRINDIYKEYLPEAQSTHEKTVSESILPEWRINGTPFTSGIINKNNQLNYHRDAGNFKGVYSNMIVMKNNCAGGYLSLPEYDLGIQCADNTLVMFDGQSILHGVTPIKYYGKDSHRFSIVYYSLAALSKSLTAEEELKKVRINRAVLEKRNAGRT